MPKLRLALWRLVYVVIAIIILVLLLPPLLNAMGLSIPGDLLQILKIALALIAFLYVCFGPETPAPF